MKRVTPWNVWAQLAAVAIAAAMFLSVSTSAQQRGQPPSAPPGGAAQPGQPAQTANMTGKGGFLDSADLLVRRIRFEAGARTYWHTHSQNQVIVAEEGEGLYQERGGAVRSFKPGEVVLLRAKVPHWHGAAAKVGVTQATMYGGTIEWGKPVTDEEYAGGRK